MKLKDPALLNNLVLSLTIAGIVSASVFSYCMNKINFFSLGPGDYGLLMAMGCCPGLFLAAGMFLPSSAYFTKHYALTPVYLLAVIFVTAGTVGLVMMLGKSFPPLYEIIIPGTRFNLSALIFALLTALGLWWVHKVFFYFKNRTPLRLIVMMVGSVLFYIYLPSLIGLYAPKALGLEGSGMYTTFILSFVTAYLFTGLTLAIEER